MAKTTTHAATFVEAEYTIALGKTGHNLHVVTERLSPEVLAHIFRYGLKQMLNDAAASGKTDDEKTGLANKKLEAMYEGTLRAGRESDPLAREARRIATDWLAKRSVKPADEDFKAKLAKVMVNPAILTLAQQNIERAKALDLDIAL